ncbi:hypothetical protein ACQP1G_16880 [Nocardia sp. CA-107356]|uniref:hypothetical protein n=1 Tax=Nocardia sp. CA-107356 TaxID=3239972 RepID=UPI003D8E03B0
MESAAMADSATDQRCAIPERADERPPATGSNDQGQARLSIVVASRDHAFTTVVSQAIGQVLDAPRPSTTVPQEADDSRYAIALRRACGFVQGTLDRSQVTVTVVDDLCALPGGSLDDSPSPLADGPQRWSANGTMLFLVDAQTAAEGADPWQRQENALAELDRIRQRTGIGLSAYSVVLYDELDAGRVYARTKCTVRQRPSVDWVLAAEAVMALADLVEARHLNPKAMLPGSQPPVTLAIELARFLSGQSSAWGLHYFTGSIVSRLIEELGNIARQAGNPVLRGPTEHSLACGALARWQLRGEPFILVATSGMVDELRGTLANLRHDRAPGFLVFGEAQPGEWYPFQGTVHAGEDARAVFAARRVPCFYLHDPTNLGADLAEAFEAYRSGRGPVVLLVGAAVLQYSGPVRIPPSPAPARPPADDRVEVLRNDPVEAAAHTLNDSPIPVLWQCGALTGEETELVYALARRAGIALTDTVTRPGTVSAYHRGRPVHEYLGTLTLYGFSPAVWRFLHPDGKLRPRDRLELLFLNTAIPDLDTPFNQATLTRNLHVTQVTEHAEQVAPFTDRAILCQPGDFLRRLNALVDPDAETVRLRRRAMVDALGGEPDLLEVVPSAPMHPEYFFAGLNQTLIRLIEAGWTYTGVYDVGRGALSAIRDLVRTGPGFSGWYGRALMGDALSAIPTLALTSADNIVAFIGDGAAQLVPSILPTLAQQLRFEGARIKGNLTVFYLVNGGFSIIRTYRELYQSATADAQMSLLTEFDAPWQARWGGVDVRREQITAFDPDALEERLTAPATVNVFDVHLAHDNANMGPLAMRTWRNRA